MKHRNQQHTVSASFAVMICFALDASAGKSFELLRTTLAALPVSTDLYVQGPGTAAAPPRCARRPFEELARA